MIAEPIEIAYRPGTDDVTILDEVLNQNEYRLPVSFDSEDVILDIGAHIGTFALACLQRGARRIFCYEPDDENFKLLQQNAGERITAYQAAVWGFPARLKFTGYLEQFNARGTVCPRTTTAGVNKDIPVAVIPIDLAIRNALQGRERLRLLKLDCEGAEFSILQNCTLLGKVDEIVGEIHDAPILGLGKRAEDLVDLLKSKGFAVHWETHPKYPFMHHFWAKRND